MSDTSPRRRMQVSLLSLLLLMTTVAAVVGLYTSRQKIEGLRGQLAPLKEENTKLRAERGALTIEDPKQIHAIRLIDPRDDLWTYRVYLPPGHDYYVAGQANRLPMGGKPPKYEPGPPPGISTMQTGMTERGGFQTATGLLPSEYLVTIALFRDEKGKKFGVQLNRTDGGAGGARLGMGITAEPGKWPAVELEKRDRRSGPLGQMTGGVREQSPTVMEVRRDPLVLLDRRYMHGDLLSSEDSDEGLIVWIGIADETPE